MSFEQAYAFAMARDGIFILHDSMSDFLQVVHKVGLPEDHNGTGTYIWDVRPVLSSGVRSMTAEPFALHTDSCFRSPPPTHIALRVVRQDRLGGGKTTLVDFHKLAERLTPKAATMLRKQYVLNVPVEFANGAAYAKGPILFGERSIRYRRECIIESACTASQLDALNELDALLNTETAQQSFVLPEGSVLFVDNYRMLHGRSKVLDPSRHLQRVRYFAH